MTTFRMMLVLAAVSGAITVGGAAALAQDSRPLVVQAKPDPDVPTRRVSYADLNLATMAGEKTLYKRVGYAVHKVCEDADGPNALTWAETSCHRFAWGGAKPQIERAVQRARDIAANGFSTIAPVTIRIAVR